MIRIGFISSLLYDNFIFLTIFSELTRCKVQMSIFPLEPDCVKLNQKHLQRYAFNNVTFDIFSLLFLAKF